MAISTLIYLTGIFFLNFMARIVLAPLLPAMVDELALSHAEAGSLFLFTSIGYFGALTGSGFFSARLQHRRTIIFSAAAVGLSTFAVAASGSLWGIRAGLLVLGVSAGLYLPSGIATLTSVVSEKHWGKALAFHELAPNLSFVAAPLVTEALLPWLDWRGILACFGAGSLLMGGIFAWFGKGGRFPGQAPSFAVLKELQALPSFWVMVLLFGMGISGTLGIFTMLPLYLVTEHGMERNWANSLIALSRIPAVGSAFLAGWAADRLGAEKTMAAVVLLTGLATISLAVLPGSWLVLGVMLQPALAACFFPVGFAVLSRLGAASARNVAVSFTVPAGFIIGGGFTPALIGFMGDRFSFSAGIVFVGVGQLLGAVLPRWLRTAGTQPAKPGA